MSADTETEDAGGEEGIVSPANVDSDEKDGNEINSAAPADEDQAEREDEEDDNKYDEDDEVEVKAEE